MSKYIVVESSSRSDKVAWYGKIKFEKVPEEPKKPRKKKDKVIGGEDK